MTSDDAVLVHRLGLCESLEVGPRTRIWAFAHVMKGAVLGADCNVGDHSFVEAGVVIGNRVTIKNHVAVWDRVTLEDDVFVGPSAVFTNDLFPRNEFRTPPEQFLPTRVRHGATIGANATIVCGTVIGEYAFVGAGAVVTKDVAPHALVLGNPAHRTGWMCACGGRLAEDLRCTCGRAYLDGGEEAGLKLVTA